tara:strand:- start:39 stop:224 length:186 start_codon:yes stop_codon:yes gene_type:complete
MARDIFGNRKITKEDMYTRKKAFTVSDVWQGWIGSIAIYNKALSAVEISQNFEMQKGYYGV